MQKRLMFFSVLLFLLLQIPLLAQVADTVDVPSIDSQGPVDVLTRFIMGDTTTTGERNNINRVYRLKRGDIYLLSGRTYYYFPLRLIADDDESVQPPVIAPFPLADGSIPRISIEVNKDSYFKNLYIQGCSPTDQRNNSDRPLYIGPSEGVRLTIENCVVEAFKVAGIYNSGTKSSVFIKDCVWRNNNWSGVFTGQFFFNSATGTMDTISIVNSTFFCGSSYFLCTNRNYVGYVRFEHNTLFINHTNPFYAPYLNNAVIKNNIFFSPASCGETAFERQQGYYDWDGQRLSAGLSIDTIPTDIANTYGITDENRRINFSNNAYYWPQSVIDEMKAHSDVELPVWMNDRTLAFFNNDAQYPNLVQENNVEADPGYNSSVMQMVDSLVNYISVFRTLGSAHAYFYNPQGGGIFPARWPLPEDFSYTNSTLLTSADGGFPLGDLNWFPDKKAKWEEWTTDVENTLLVVPKEFSLVQNFPNPFNPTTNIQFSLPARGFTTLKVFDVLGSEVATLLNKEMIAGTHFVNFNAQKLTSGIYFYQLESGKLISVKKMMLIK